MASREYHRLAVQAWRERNPGLARERSRLDRAKRRARVAGARVEKHIRVKWLHNWESKLCGICDLLIEDDYHIDHIIPLTKGGAHTTTNLQLAHPFCNRSKSNKLASDSVSVTITLEV